MIQFLKKGFVLSLQICMIKINQLKCQFRKITKIKYEITKIID